MNSLSAIELTELIARARDGCSESLGTLLELYRSYLRLIASVQLGSQFQDKFSPSDVIQATFMQAHKGFAGFAGRSEGELIAWLRKILVSQMIMEIRRYAAQARDVKLERQMHAQLDESSVLLAGMLADRGNSPSQSAMRRERAVLLADALDQLPDDYREVIVLRHLKGHRFGEIAEQMSRSVDSVKAVWRRALGQLRELIDDGTI